MYGELNTQILINLHAEGKGHLSRADQIIISLFQTVCKI